MKKLEYVAYIVVKAASEGEARGLLGKAQDMLEEHGMVLVIEDGTPIEIEDEEEEDDVTHQGSA